MSEAHEQVKHRTVATQIMLGWYATELLKSESAPQDGTQEWNI